MYACVGVVYGNHAFHLGNLNAVRGVLDHTIESVLVRHSQRVTRRDSGSASCDLHYCFADGTDGMIGIGDPVGIDRAS